MVDNRGRSSARVFDTHRFPLQDSVAEFEEEQRKPRDREISRQHEDYERVRQHVENFFGRGVSVVFDQAYTTEEFEVPHSLGVVPSDAIIGVPSVDARIYYGDSEWTRNAIYLHTTAACSVRVYLVV
jgi:hypothetical protein